MHALAHIRMLYDFEDEAKTRVQAIEQNFAAPKDSAAARVDCLNEAAERDAFARPSTTSAPVPINAASVQTIETLSLQAPRAEVIRSLRHEKSVPRLNQFKTWLESQQAARGGPVLPKSPMGQAITYALNQWDALCVYTTDGDLAIDNNAAENALRRVAIGRKNWLFCGSDNGGNTAAVLFTLIATCQRHKVEPFTYLRDVLTRIAATPMDQLDEFLPVRRTHRNQSNADVAVASA